MPIDSDNMKFDLGWKLCPVKIEVRMLEFAMFIKYLYRTINDYDILQKIILVGLWL